MKNEKTKITFQYYVPVLDAYFDSKTEMEKAIAEYSREQEVAQRKAEEYAKEKAQLEKQRNEYNKALEAFKNKYRKEEEEEDADIVTQWLTDMLNDIIKGE